MISSSHKEEIERESTQENTDYLLSSVTHAEESVQGDR